MLKPVPSFMGHVLELSGYVVKLRRRSKGATPKRDDLARRFVELCVFCSATIFHEQAVKAPICSLPNGAADTDIGGYASNDQVLYAFIPEEKLKVRIRESPTPWFIDDGLSGDGVELWYYVMSLLTTYHESPKRPWISNTEA